MSKKMTMLKNNIGLGIVAMMLLGLVGITTPVMAADNQTKVGENITKPVPPPELPPVVTDAVNPTGIRFEPPELTKASKVEIPAAMSIGQKVRVSETTEITFMGSNGKDNQYKATISAPTYLPDLTTKIQCQWGYDNDNHQWYTKPNLFYAVVEGQTTIVSYQDKRYSWTPTVSVGGKVLKAGYTFNLPVDPVNHNYIGNTLQWNYGDGITRNLRIIEGMLIEYYTIAYAPQGNIVITNNAKEDAGFTWESLDTAWDADSKPVPLTIVNGVVTLTAAEAGKYKFPITIDPSTSFTTSASDGYFETYDATYATARTQASADSIGTSGLNAFIGQAGVPYNVWRAAFYFDTSSIPDSATVTVGTLKLYGQDDGSVVNFTIQIQDGMATYPHDPMVVGDYNLANYADNHGTFASAGFVTTGYNSIALGATGMAAVNKTGTTKFLLRSQEDINNSAPTDSEYVGVWSYEKGAGYRPTLDITYTSSAAPAVTTTAATDIAQTTATVNAFLDNDNGEPCDVRFAYDNDAPGAPYANATAWVDDTYETGDYPSAALTGLTAGNTYYFRVEAKNTTGTTNGGELSFLTTASLMPPTNFTATPRSDTELSLSWTKGYGAGTTHIQYKTGAYPTTNADGTNAYSSTGNSVLLDGLETGITYYFKAWGKDGAAYSATNTTEMATTLAAGEVADALGTPTTPPNFWGPPTTTALENLPFYDIINMGADSLGMPRTTLWIILFMGIAIVIGMVLYVMTGNPIMALLGTGGGIVYSFMTGLMPVWILIAYIILAGSILFVKSRGEAG